MPPCTWPRAESVNILIVAGEASGDAHAAKLVAALQELAPQAVFLGIGGPALAAQGVRIIFPAAALAVTGLIEVLGRLPAIARALRLVAQTLRETRPALVILVDFPDFNFWVARLARYYQVPVMYYISPQVWAWRTYRVHTLARLVTRLVVIFPFEAEFYRQRGMFVTYVGHPFRELLPALPPREQLLTRWDLPADRLTIALLPGSRASEIDRILPVMAAGAELATRSMKDCQFVVPVAPTVPAELVQRHLKDFPGKIRIIPGPAYIVLAASHLAVAASGTATVEAALAATPTIIVYRISPLSFAVGKKLIRVDHIGMANLLAGERLFPELIQDDFTPARLAEEMVTLLTQPERLGFLKQGLIRIISRLGGPGASRRAAQVAMELLAAGREP